jgi:hypothetical protein
MGLARQILARPADFRQDGIAFHDFIMALHPDHSMGFVFHRFVM